MPSKTADPSPTPTVGRVRELRTLVGLEVAVILGLALAPMDPTFAVIGLLVAATASRAVRGRGFRELVHARPYTILVGVLAGAAALALATPSIRLFGTTPIEPWYIPLLRDDPAQLARYVGQAIAVSIALELALRGWIIERFIELSPGPAAMPIAAAALVEVLLVAGPIPSRLGAGLFGVGLGLLYISSGRNVLVPIAARAAFTAGAVVTAVYL